MNVKMCVRHVQ